MCGIVGYVGPKPLLPVLIEGLRRLKREREILENSDAYFSMFPACFAGRPLPIPCRAPETSLVVDCYGRVFPCVPLSEVDRPIGRVTGRTLVRLS